MAKKLRVLDNVSGVEQIMNVSSLTTNSTISGSDLMILEQSNEIKKVSITDLSAEFGGSGITGTENNTVRFDASGDLVETDYLTIDESYDGGNGVVTSFNLETENIHFAKYNVYVGKDKDENSYNGNIELFNDNDNYIQFNMNGNSTENLVLSIEDTKATLEDGDILVYNTANETFKVDNISNYVTAGTGNYHVLKVEFSAGSDFATTTVIPEGAQIDKFVIISGGLTTGTAPLTFSIGDVSNITLATQGAEFDNTAGTFTINYLNAGTNFVIGVGESGTFRSNWAGAGFGTGSGYGYLFYWTELL
jgi:hypothetical protein